MTSKKSFGKVQTYLYLIHKNNEKKMYELHISRLESEDTEPENVKYMGKFFQDGYYRKISWILLEARSDEDAIAELKCYIDKEKHD